MSDVPGSGKDGRVLKEDILKYIENIKIATQAGRSLSQDVLSDGNSEQYDLVNMLSAQMVSMGLVCGHYLVCMWLVCGQYVVDMWSESGQYVVGKGGQYVVGEGGQYCMWLVMKVMWSVSGRYRWSVCVRYVVSISSVCGWYVVSISSVCGWYVVSMCYVVAKGGQYVVGKGCQYVVSNGGDVVSKWLVLKEEISKYVENIRQVGVQQDVLSDTEKMDSFEKLEIESINQKALESEE